MLRGADGIRTEGPIPISRALAIWLAAIEWPVQCVDIPGVYGRSTGVSAPVKAELGVNVFFEVETNLVMNQGAYRQAAISFILEGSTMRMSAGAAQNNLGSTAAAVSARVWGSSLAGAVDTAQRLWETFSNRPFFEAQRKIYDAQGNVVGRIPDLAVRLVYPSSEPKVVERLESGATKVEFGLFVHYTRTKNHAR